MVALLQKLQLAPQRTGMHQVTVQSHILDFVTCREHTMVCHNRGTSTGRVAQVTAPRQYGKDNVLQSRTDESQDTS